MNDLRKAAEMALAKLDHLWEIGIDAQFKVELLPEIRALRQALAQPEQEPVARLYNGHLHECDPSYWVEIEVKPLYTAPPPKRKWVGLTDEEIENLMNATGIFGGLTPDEIALARAIEAKLREKNT